MKVIYKSKNSETTVKLSYTEARQFLSCQTVVEDVRELVRKAWNLNNPDESHASDCASRQHTASECTCGLADRLEAQGE